MHLLHLGAISLHLGEIDPRGGRLVRGLALACAPLLVPLLALLRHRGLELVPRTLSLLPRLSLTHKHRLRLPQLPLQLHLSLRAARQLGDQPALLLARRGETLGRPLVRRHLLTHLCLLGTARRLPCLTHRLRHPRFHLLNPPSALGLHLPKLRPRAPPLLFCIRQCGLLRRARRLELLLQLLLPLARLLLRLGDRLLLHRRHRRHLLHCRICVHRDARGGHVDNRLRALGPRQRRERLGVVAHQRRHRVDHHRLRVAAERLL